MLNKEIEKAMQQIMEEERKRILARCASNETVLMFPAKVTLSESGFIERISVLNTKPYFKVNETASKKYCPICHELVENDLFIQSKEGQKIHIECYSASQK